MKTMMLTVAAALTLGSFAHASRGAYDATELAEMTSMTTVWPFFSTGFTTFGTMSKEIADAQEDIAVFVASEGQVRTARFEGALAWSKANLNTVGASDLQIAQGLLGSFTAQ